MTKTISIITPCYNEEASIRECYETVKRVFEESLPGYAREHIFCDNASKDKTVDILREIAADDNSIKIIVNSRNFGVVRSHFNAFRTAGGDAVIVVMPADIQDPPEMIPEFVKLWESGYEIVYGIRETREEPFLMQGMRKLYYKLLSKISYIDIPRDVGDYQLIDRSVHQAILSFNDAYPPFMRARTFECGFKSAGVSYRMKGRKHGKSRNRFLDLIDQGLFGVISVSTAPMRLSLYAGVIISILSILYGVVSFIGHVVHYREVAAPGIATLIVALFIFSGIQLFFIGFLGEYVLAIYNQVRRQPIVIERERINYDDNTGTAGEVGHRT